MTLETTHLRLIPFAPEYVLALLEGVPQFEQKTGLRAAEGLRDMYVSEDVSPGWLAQLRAAKETDFWQHGFAIIDRESGTVIGGAGFKGPPDAAGMVEIAYGLAPGFRGRGFATEAAAALTAFVSKQENIRLVRAHTLPTANASTRVLAKCGFRHVGEVVDPQDGLVWRWERPADAS